MSDLLDPHAMAARLRGLFGSQDRHTIGAAARRLRVTERALRVATDEHSPHPSIEVLAAVIREYGVDPSWLLTGEYDPATHRAALDDDANLTKDEFVRMIGAEIAKRRTPADGLR